MRASDVRERLLVCGLVIALAVGRHIEVVDVMDG